MSILDQIPLGTVFTFTDGADQVVANGKSRYPVYLNVTVGRWMAFEIAQRLIAQLARPENESVTFSLAGVMQETDDE